MRKLFLFAFILGNLLANAGSNPGLKFIENKNQWPVSFQFLAKIPGGHMALQPGKFSYYFLDYKKIEELHHHSHNHVPLTGDEWQQDQYINGRAIDVTFVSANLLSKPSRFGKSAEYYNYFVGSDTSKWAAKAFAYNEIVYPSIYNGIDLKVYSVELNGKYDLMIAPQADPSQIIIQYDGADQLLLDNGNLYVKTSLAEIIEKRPYAYQVINGEKREVRCEFNLHGNQVSFHFPHGYDPCFELVIDPLLIFSTYSGSTADNWGSTATPGENGNLYSAGVTNENLGGKFPSTTGAFQTSYGGLYDIGILKYDSAGEQLLYASYLGGEGSESPHSLVMNAAEELIIFGTTSSFSFPTSISAYSKDFSGGTQLAHVVSYDNGSDIFVTRVSQDGSQLLASTYIGGSENDGLNDNTSVLSRNYGDQLRGDVITDKTGNIYISSVTASTDFPAINSLHTLYKGGSSDALLLKLPADLSAISWSMFLGGSKTDAAYTLKLDKNEDIYIGGGTSSDDFPISENVLQNYLAGDVDGWIARISNGGDKIYHATYTGTVAYDQIYFLDLDEVGEVYVYGQTSGNFPILPNTSAVYNKPHSGQFVQKFTSDLSSLIFSTVFGSGDGTPDISPTAFIVNECNNLYMAGWGGILNTTFGGWSTSTQGLETTSDALQRTTSGNDFYFLVLTDDASELLYATFLGGAQSRTHVDGGTSRFDKSGIVYHAVCSGCASGNTAGRSTSDFPTTRNAWSRTNRSQNCNNAAFKFDLSSLKARLQTNSVRLDMPGVNKICLPDKIVFQNYSTGGETYEWDLGDGTRFTTGDTARIVHQYKTIGRYKISLAAIDPGTCKVRDVAFTFVTVFNVEAFIQDDDDVCEDNSYNLKAGGAAQYYWISDDGTFQSDQASPTVFPTDTTVYYLTLTEVNGCIRRDTVQLNVIPVIKPDFEIVRHADCFTTPSVHVENLTDSLWIGDRMFFDYGDGTTEDIITGEHHYKESSVYNVKLVAVREFCVTEKVVSMPFFKLNIPNVITPLIKDGANDAFVIQFGDDEKTTPRDYDYNVSLIIYNRWGHKVYESENYQYDWAGEGLAGGIYYFEATVEGHATCKSWIQLVR